MKSRTALSVVMLILLIAVATSCVVKQSQVITDVRPNTAATVEAKAKGVGILSLSAPALNGKAEQKLLAECNGAEVVNVNSELRRRDFLIVQVYTLKLTGECKE